MLTAEDRLRLCVPWPRRRPRWPRGGTLQSGNHGRGVSCACFSALGISAAFTECPGTTATAARGRAKEAHFAESRMWWVPEQGPRRQRHCRRCVAAVCGFGLSGPGPAQASAAVLMRPPATRFRRCCSSAGRADGDGHFDTRGAMRHHSGICVVAQLSAMPPG